MLYIIGLMKTWMQEAKLWPIWVGLLLVVGCRQPETIPANGVPTAVTHSLETAATMMPTHTPSSVTASPLAVGPLVENTLLQGEMVKPALRDPQRWGDAVCNDGTPFGFALQLSPSGRSDDWVIYLQGGSFCDDNALPCSRRKAILTTTPNMADQALLTMGQGGIFSSQATQNPLFYDANRAFAFYCSSDVWSGSVAERRATTGSADGWYFTGRLNVQAMLEVLIQQYGLDDTNPNTAVLFAGGSAGGVGVQVNADLIAKLLPHTAVAGRLKLLNDAGVTIHFDHPTYRPGNATTSFVTVLRDGYDFWESRLNPQCEQVHLQAGEHPGNCFQERIVHPFITQAPPQGLGLPLLVQYAALDSYGLQLHRIDPTVDSIIREQWRTAALEAIPNATWFFSNGRRPYHTVLRQAHLWDQGPPDQQFIHILTQFWQGGPPQHITFGNP